MPPANVGAHQDLPLTVHLSDRQLHAGIGTSFTVLLISAYAHRYINEWGLYEIWAKANPALIADYERRLKIAVKAAAKARRDDEELAKRGPTR